MTRRRHLTILDVMILTAATAVGVTFALQYNIDYQAPSPFRFLDWMRGAPSCLAVAIALAAAPLRLRQPRPEMRQVLRQPGFVACASVVLGAGVGATLHGIHMIARRLLHGAWPDSPTILFNSLWHGAFIYVPFAVVGAWLTLGMSGQWQAEKSWIDRLGRAVGAYWIGYIALDVAAPVVALLPFLP